MAFKALPVTHKPSVSILLVLVEFSSPSPGKAARSGWASTLRVSGQRWRVSHSTKGKADHGVETGHRYRIDLETTDFLPPNSEKSWAKQGYSLKARWRDLRPHPDGGVGGPCDTRPSCSTGGAGEGLCPGVPPSRIPEGGAQC